MSSNQGPPSTPRVNKVKGSTPKTQEGIGNGRKYGRKHEEKCQIGTGNCYNKSKSGHVKRDCTMMKAQGRAKILKHKPVLPIRKLQKRITLMLFVLKVKSRVLPMWCLVCYMSFLLMIMIYLIRVLPCYLLLPWYLGNFMYCLNIVNKPFMVSTPLGDSVIAKRVYSNCHIMCLIELLMLNL